MDRTKILAGLIASLALAACAGDKAQRAIRVGSKNFTEQVVLGEILAQHLEQRLHRRVERSLNLGGTLLAHRALLNGDIDLYPEYTGTGLRVVLGDTSTGDAAAVLARVRAEYLRRFHVEWLDPLGIDNGFAMVVRGKDARRSHLATLTDAARSTVPWALGVGYEFEQRADGMHALEATYHFAWSAAPKSMDLGLLYKALDGGQVSMIAANATDGLLSTMDLKVLADDRHAFPPYQVCVAVRADSLREIAGLREALLELSGRFSNDTMRKLNYQVDGLHVPVAEAAADFLKQAGLRPQAPLR